MRTLSQRELLAVWEAGLDLALPERAVELVRAADADDDPARLTPGQCDALLLDIRERLFGSEIPAAAKCPRCGEDHEFQMRVGDIRMKSLPAPPELSLSESGCAVTFRLPEAADLIAVSSKCSGEAEMRDALLERCILRATRNDREIAPTELNSAIRDAISTRMGEADPQGEVELSMRCTACEFGWLELFDVVSFFWSEIQSWALRTLNEVHQLAAAYGWSESDALAVSSRRRAFYLGLNRRLSGMPDYLGNLVHRSLAPAGIRPRARSLFEPAKGAPGAGDLEFEKHVTIERRPAPGVSENSDAAAAPAAIPFRTETQPSQQIVTANRLQMKAEAPVAGRQPVEDRTLATPVPPGQTNPSSRAPQSARSEEATRSARSIPKQESLAESPRRESQRMPDAVAAPKTIPAVEQTRTDPSPASIRELRTERIAESRPSLLEPLTRIPMPVRPVVTQVAEAGRDEAGSAPEVHIAIGRVVVHAAPPAASHPISAPRSYKPQVSLEQYLQNRGGRA